jgi:tetratricopeptide (TPR) repeat protein
MQLVCTDESAQLQEEAVLRALDLEPNLGEAYASLGVLYRFQGRFEDVEDAFKRAITLNPNYARAWNVYAEWLLNFQTRIDEAIELAEKAALLDPRSVKVSAVLGRSYEKRGLFSLAERQYLKVIELDSNNSEGLLALGSMYLSSIGRYQEGLKYLREAAKLAPGDMYNLYLILRAHMELGNMPAAEGARQRMIETDATHPLIAFANVKMSLYKIDLEEARIALDLLMQKISHIPDWAAQQGRIELILGDPQRALDIYLTFTPDWRNPDRWPELLELFKNHACTVAWLMINTGETQLGEELLAQSVVFFEEALPTVFEHPDGNRPEICYLTVGEKEKALSSIKTQLDHNHLFEWTEVHRQPMYDLIRDEPRYQDILQERKRRISIQREAMEATGE